LYMFKKPKISVRKSENGASFQQFIGRRDWGKRHEFA